MRNRRTTAALLTVLLATASPLLAQTTQAEGDQVDTESGNDPIDGPLFGDPFAEPADDAGPEPGSLPVTPADPFADPFADPIGDPFADPFADPFGNSDGGGSLIETIEEPAEGGGGENAAELLLTREDGLRWGGRFSASIGNSWTWDAVGTSGFDLQDPANSLSPRISTRLFFDARPEADFRVYGELILESGDTDDAADLGALVTDDAIADALPDGFSLEENEDGDQVIVDAGGNVLVNLGPAEEEEDDADADDDEGNLGSPVSLSLAVDELFSDFQTGDRVFYRIGKYTIQWGVGFFFSPADVVNLTAIDPEDPEADRDGPVSLKVDYPFGIGSSALGYLILNTGAETWDAAIAPRLDFLLLDGEARVGAYYQRTLSPRLVGTYTRTLGQWDVFGEGVLSWGSDRTFVRVSDDQSAANTDPEDGLDLVLDTFSIEDRLLGAATIGARTTRDVGDDLSLTAVGQYFRNSDGYRRELTSVDGPVSLPEVLAAAARLQQNPAENGAVIDSEDEQPEGYVAPPDLGIDDLSNFGRHYVAGLASLSGLADGDIGLSVLILANLSDLSGVVSPSVSVSLFDTFNVNLSVRQTFGPPNGEFTNPFATFSGSDDPEVLAPTLQFSLDLSLGGGSF